MFLRRFERRKNGKPHSYWALVESYRMAKGSRQRVVAYLGELSSDEQDGWAKLGSHLGGEAKARRPQLSLFDPPRRDEPRDDEPLLVKLSSIRLERPRDFGDVWLAWGLWRMLGLDELLDKLIEPGREDVSWGAMAAILTVARFCEPSSELHIADTWYRRTALEELLGVTPKQVHTDRLYKALDQLLPHKEALEKHLRERLGELFELKCDLLLYDVVPSPDGGETFILARSADRRAKELAMHERFIARLETGLKKMQAAAESGRLKDEATANQRLGRLKQQNWRASQAFEVTIKKLAEPCGKQRLEITWQRQAKFADWSQLSDGCYLLRSNLTGVDAATLWRRYIQLTEAEWAFRITKDELLIRPIWHHKEDRVKAHILVCFLAYVLWKTLAGWMRGAGLGDAPRTVIEDLAKLKCGDVVLRARSPRGGPERRITLRCVTEPDEAQAVVLHRLGLTPPRRLRRLEELHQM